MRILLTRPRPDAERTATQIADLGHEAVVAPVIEILPTRAALPGGPFDAILATSSNATTTLESLPISFRAKPVYAVGRRTAEAARASGFRDVRTSEGDGEALAALVVLTLRRPACLLYLAGHDRKPTIETVLREAGYEVHTLVAYEARAIAAWPAEVIEDLRADRIDGGLHYSRRSAALALEAAERHGCREGFLRLRHWCLSADVAAALGAAERVAVAPRPTESALLSLLPVAAPDPSS